MNRKILIILGCLFFQYVSANAQALPPQIFGEWKTVQKDDNIFDGNVHITTVKTSPGAPTDEILLIYDDTQRGLLCSLLPLLEKGLICGAAYITKKEVTPEDRSDLVTQSIPDLPPVYIQLEKKDNMLAINGCSLNRDDCMNGDSQKLFIWSLLKR